MRSLGTNLKRSDTQSAVATKGHTETVGVATKNDWNSGPIRDGSRRVYSTRTETDPL